MSNKICCALCSKEHDLAFAGSETGYGCAGFARGGYLSGHYGSVIADMTAFEIKGVNLPEEKPICDECISKMIDAGQLIEIKRGAGEAPQLDESVQRMLADFSRKA